ncbi:MAG: hypothetical protein WDN45_14815 [Caulobacteraceae bacterium]
MADPTQQTLVAVKAGDVVLGLYAGARLHRPARPAGAAGGCSCPCADRLRAADALYPRPRGRPAPAAGRDLRVPHRQRPGRRGGGARGPGHRLLPCGDRPARGVDARPARPVQGGPADLGGDARGPEVEPPCRAAFDLLVEGMRGYVASQKEG